MELWTRDKNQEKKKGSCTKYIIQHNSFCFFLSLGYRILLEVWSLKGREDGSKVEFGNDPAVLLEKAQKIFLYFFLLFFLSS